MKVLLQKIPQNKGNLYNILVLVGGTVLGQGLTIIISPWLTRLYSPGAFGTLAVYGALLGVLVTLASLRYELAIPLADDDESANNLVALSLVIVLVTAALSTILVMTLGPALTVWINTPALAGYLWLLPIGVIGAGTYQVLNNYAIRKKAFGRLGLTKLSQGLSQALVQLGLGLLGADPLGLLLGDVAGRVGGSGSLGKMVWKMEAKGLRSVSLKHMMAVARQYSNYPLVSSASALLNIASAQLPTLLISTLFGSVVLGLFSLGARILQIPVGIIGQAVSQVFYSQASEARRSGQLARYTRRTFRDLVSLGMAPILFIGLVAPAAFAFIFGEQWRDAGTYCLWLSPWLFFVFVSSPLSRLVFVVNQQSGELIFQGTLLLARVLSLSVGAAIGGAMTALRIYGVVSALCWMFYSLWLLRIAGSNFRSTVSVLLHEGGVVAVILVPMLVVQTLSNGSVKLVALLAVLTGAVVLGRVAIVVRKMSFDQPSHMGD